MHLKPLKVYTMYYREQPAYRQGTSLNVIFYKMWQEFEMEMERTQWGRRPNVARHAEERWRLFVRKVRAPAHTELLFIKTITKLIPDLAVFLKPPSVLPRP